MTELSLHIRSLHYYQFTNASRDITHLSSFGSSIWECSDKPELYEFVIPSSSTEPASTEIDFSIGEPGYHHRGMSPSVTVGLD